MRKFVLASEFSMRHRKRSVRHPHSTIKKYSSLLDKGLKLGVQYAIPVERIDRVSLTQGGYALIYAKGCNEELVLTDEENKVLVLTDEENKVLKFDSLKAVVSLIGEL